MSDWWRTANTGIPVAAMTPTITSPSTAIQSNRVRMVPVRLARTEAKLNLIQFSAGISCELEKAKQVSLTRCKNASTNTEKKRRRFGKDKQEEEVEEVETATLTYTGEHDKQKLFRGAPGGGIKDNSAFYVLRLVDGKYIEAYPVDQWISYSPMTTLNTLDYDQIQQEYENRNKPHSRWYMKAKLKSNSSAAEDKDQTAESDKGSLVSKEKNKLTLVEAEEWIGSDDENTMDQNSGAMDDDLKLPRPKKGQNKKTKAEFKAVSNKGGRYRRAAERLNSESEFTEESDDGDREADEFDYSDDESSGSSDQFEEEEEKGIDQEILPQKAEAGEDEDSVNEDEDLLTEEGKELARLLNEYETGDKVPIAEDSDFNSSESSSDIEQQLEKSLKSSCVLLLESSQKSQKQQMKRSSTASSSGVKRKRSVKKEPNGGVK